MSDIGYITYVLNSSDAGANPYTPDANNPNSDFVCTLAEPLNLPGSWECCLVSATFQNPVSPPASVLIFLDILDDSSVGNNSLPFLYNTRTIHVGDQTPSTIEHLTTILQWKPVRRTHTQNIRVTLQDSKGNWLPGPNPGPPPFIPTPTTVQFILRQVSSQAR